jgi:CheY-like chemotaxis protein
MKSEITPKTGRILIVDDEEIIHQTLKRLLISEEYTIDSGYDLVICDIRIPDMDGIEVLREIRKREIDMEMLMLTSYASLENATEVFDYGALDYLTKPIENIAEFRARVGEAVYSAQTARR